jgi:hypothetical protein
MQGQSIPPPEFRTGFIQHAQKADSQPLAYIFDLRYELIINDLIMAILLV